MKIFIAATRLVFAGAMTLASVTGYARTDDTPLADSTLRQLKSLSLEELGQIEVTSVSRKPEKLSTAAAAITLITQEDIRKSGMTSLPELLRQVPGMYVGKIDSSKWAIGSRGGANQFGKQMLMLVDGRTTYTPLFSGIYWDEQEMMLEDIERIEVIRGPGSTVWGSNAVNGVINVTSKSSKDTQGGLITGGGGVEGSFGSLRYGGTLGNDATYRVYATHQNYNEGLLADGSPATDDWDITRGGFRADWALDDPNTLTLQADIYSGLEGSSGAFTSITPPYYALRDFATNVSGGNILGRWDHRFSEDSDMSLQFYYDLKERRDTQWDLTLETSDLDFQHRFPLSERQEIVWGLGYRHYQDEVIGSFGASLDPNQKALHWLTGFIQDEITLAEDRLKLTLGTKIEHTHNTGYEVQPSARLSWTPNDQHALWGAVSRAMRTPSRFDNNGRLNVAVIPGATTTVIGLSGNPDIESEEMVAYEMGYRFLGMQNLTFDVSTFYNVYDNMLIHESRPPIFEAFPSPPHLTILSQMSNVMRAETYGAEFSSTWKVTDLWELGAGYSWFKDNLHAPTAQTAAEGREEQSPNQMLFLRSSLDLPKDVSLGASLNLMDSISDSISGTLTPSYVRLDVRLGWLATETLELSLVGQNLLDPSHPEFGGTSVQNTETQRVVYGKATLHF